MFAIGQTVMFKGSVKGHVVFVTATEISVRTSLTGATINCKPKELEILSEEALPLEQPRDYQTACIATIVSALGPLHMHVNAKKIPAAGTKLARAQALFITGRDDGNSRKQTIAQFVEKLQMTEAGASTYYSMCQKASLN